MKPDALDKWIETKGKDKAMDYAKAREKEVNVPGYKEPTNEKSYLVSEYKHPFFQLLFNFNVSFFTP